MILAAAKKAYRSGALQTDEFPAVEIEEPQLETHGDFSTNFAMMTASAQKMPPRDIARAIKNQLTDPDQILTDTEIAGPGFINFFVKPSAWYPILRRIHADDLRYGASNIGQGVKIQIEFVSSNPTGPLHVGHGRGAAVGDSVGNILAFSGYDVQKEYYINDSGRQIRTLGHSVWLRYKALAGEETVFPAECYQGEYISDIARRIQAEKEDLLKAQSKDDAISICARFAAREILAGIKDDLDSFGVTFDKWFSEQDLYASGEVARILEKFRAEKIIY